MPLSVKDVHLDGVRNRERERRASVYSSGSDSGSGVTDDLDSELADLGMRRLNLDSVGAWPRGKVPYEINAYLLRSHPKIVRTIQRGIKTFNQQVASVEWVEREDDEDFVEFVYNEEHCQSYMGCIGGQQPLELADWATTGTVLHEMGHAIGLAHEQCRLDRDRFVKVHTSRIEEGEAHNFEIITDGVPLGPYDYDSIMHYDACAFSKDGLATIEAPPAAAKRIGQRKEFSDSDLKGIDAIYGPLQCTYEQHGEKYWPQYWYECRTCWGEASDYGCCLVCALSCHSGPDHLLIRHKISPKGVFACDCGRNHHQQAVCTWHATKETAVKQPLYHCRDCFKSGEERCCYQCKKTCHAGHRVVETGIMKGYCQCGMKRCKIECRIPNPTCDDECTYNTAGDVYHSQPWYECRSCWGGESNYGCCLSCAFNCHKGHILFYRPAADVWSVCDCGRNEHQKSVCTWHSTKTKLVKQPFYQCYDCFQDDDEGCCYQCVKKCHDGHDTSYAGIITAYCDCGSEPCQIHCTIPKPLTRKSRDTSYRYQLERRPLSYHADHRKRK